jgi:hypothetical protein
VRRSSRRNGSFRGKRYEDERPPGHPASWFEHALCANEHYAARGSFADGTLGRCR